MHRSYEQHVTGIYRLYAVSCIQLRVYISFSAYSSVEGNMLFLQLMSLCFHMSRQFNKNVSLFCCVKVFLKFYLVNLQNYVRYIFADLKMTYYIRQAGRRLDLLAQPKFCCHGNKGRPHNIVHGSIESAIPESPLIGPNISGLSVVQADLQAILCKYQGVNFGR